MRDNARAALAAIARQGALNCYRWSFVGDTPICNHWTERGRVSATTAKSDLMSKALRRDGFRFVGSTLCCAAMQASCMVDDHLRHCFRHSPDWHTQE
ncbi:DNA-3-methyladenine glycosylase I [Rhodopila sp.]|uniref:DNA-3-methyladenine glycosylase I n=1 Tax=Rhodopila sp. TaxID=2480087 RepID=UPI003D11CE76